MQRSTKDEKSKKDSDSWVLSAQQDDDEELNDNSKLDNMFETFEKTLQEDSTREDGFEFRCGNYFDSRRSRRTPGIFHQQIRHHSLSVRSSSVLSLPVSTLNSEDASPNLLYLVAFGDDQISIWNLKPLKLLHSMILDKINTHGIVGVAKAIRGSIRPQIVLAYATSCEPIVHIFDLDLMQMLPAIEIPRLNNTFHYYNPSQIKNLNLPKSTNWSGHHQRISCMALEENGNLLATGSWDSTCMIWQINVSRDTDNNYHVGGTLALVTILAVHIDGVWSCQFSTDGKTLLAAGDSTILQWTIPSTNITQEMVNNNMLGQRQDWEAAILYALDYQSTREVLTQGNLMPFLPSNSEWFDTTYRRCTTVNESKVLWLPHAPEEPYDTVEELSRIVDISCEHPRVLEYFLNPALPTLTPSPGRYIYRPTILPPQEHAWYVQTFQSRSIDNKYSAHSTPITGISVSTKFGFAVTVAIDRSIKTWCLENGLAYSTKHDAHTLPILCCALTDEQTCLSIDEMKLATGAQDNCIKLWRFQQENRGKKLSPLEVNEPSPSLLTVICLHTLIGHYDSVWSCSFDPHGVYLLSTANNSSVIMWQIQPTRPCQVTGLRIVCVDAYAVTLEWDEPLTSGESLISYIIKVKQVKEDTDSISQLSMNDPSRIERISADATLTQITLLQPGTQYTFQVAAVNNLGVGDFSVATGVVETLSSIPSAIAKSAAIDQISTTSVRLTWLSPCSNGAKITSYTIRCLPENKHDVPCKEVKVQLSELCNSSSTIEKGKSTKKDAEYVENKTVQHSYLKLAKTDKLHKYLDPKSLQSKRNVGIGENTINTIQNCEISYIVQGLLAGEVYQFQLASENRCGLGTFSPLSDYITLQASAPDQPLKPCVVDIQTHQVTVEWKKPRSNGSEILMYIIRWTQREDYNDEFHLNDFNDVEKCENTAHSLTCSNATLLTHSLIGTQFTVVGLSPGKSFVCWISATNRIHNKLYESKCSVASARVYTKCDVPDVPRDVILCNPSSHSFEIKFRVPQDNGHKIEYYTVQLFREDMRDTVSFKSTSELVRVFDVSSDNLYTLCNIQPHITRMLYSGEKHDNSLLTGSEMKNPFEAQVGFKVTRLQASTSYTVILAAYNKLGLGPYSEKLINHQSEIDNNCILITTMAPNPPASLLNPPIISNVHPRWADISWVQPEHDGGAPLVGFKLQYCMTKSNSNDTVEASYSPTIEKTIEVANYNPKQTELRVDFLQPKMKYRFRVAAWNSIGIACFSPYSNDIITPSLVEYTLQQYFSNRPEVEHQQARIIQNCYRLWRANKDRKLYLNTELNSVLHTEQHTL